MAYVPFTNDYSSLRSAQFVANEYARRTAVQSRVNDIITGGNQVMGGLVADCCSDPAYAGQGFYSSDPSPVASLIAALTPASTDNSSNPDLAALIAQTSRYPLTPVDILTGTYGFPLRRDGRPWPRPRLYPSERRARVNAYPSFGPAFDTTALVPPCPCFSNAAPIPITVPVVSAAPARPASCPAGSVHNAAGMCDPLQPGMSGLGQDDPANVGGFLAILGLFGIVVWASRK